MLEGNRVLTHTFSKKLELQINIRGCRSLLLKIEDNRGKKLLDGSGCYVEEKKKKREIEVEGEEEERRRRRGRGRGGRLSRWGDPVWYFFNLQFIQISNNCDERGN